MTSLSSVFSVLQGRLEIIISLLSTCSLFWLIYLVCNSWDDIPTLVRVPELHGDDVAGILFQDGSDEFARASRKSFQLLWTCSLCLVQLSGILFELRSDHHCKPCIY